MIKIKLLHYKIFALLTVSFALSLYSNLSGKDLDIKSVQFLGNKAFSSSQLKKVMVSRPSTFLHPSDYHPQVLDEDLNNIELFYHQHGYLSAKITNHNVEIDSSKNEVHIHITISEGVQTHVEEISLFGNHFFPDSLLMTLIKIKPGDPLDRNNIENANIAILSKYANNGFLNAAAKPDIRVNADTHTALLDFMINEGIQYTIDSIHIEGLQKTQKFVVVRELKFKSGQVVHYSRLLESQQNLYETGLFQSVYIQPAKPSNGDSTQKNILVQVKEIPSGEFNVSIGYGTVDKARGRIEIYNNNVRGTSRKIGAAATASFIQRSIRSSFTEPWTFGTRWRTDVNVSLAYQNEPGYNFRRIGGRITEGREFLKQSNALLTYRLDYGKLSNVKTTEIPNDLTNNVGSLKLTLVYDTRDDLFNTIEGLFFDISNEFAGIVLNSSVDFFRSIVDFKYFHPLTSGTVLATNIRFGWMDSPNNLAGIPLNERFYAGGPKTLRGFNYQEVGPRGSNGIPLGGRMQLIWNVFEIRQTIYKFLGGVLFTDMGNVWSVPKDFKPNSLRTDIGIGLRVNTPIGLAGLDYGINVDRKPGEPAGKLYFGMGQSF